MLASFTSMKVHASLYSYSTKSGAPIVWEFCETAGGKFGATNGIQWKPASDIDDLRSTYRTFLGYTRKDGSLTFSRTPLVCALPVSA